jgi:hypothetical protein
MHLNFLLILGYKLKGTSKNRPREKMVRTLLLQGHKVRSI